MRVCWASSSGSRLSWAGARCWMTTKAAPLSGGMASKNALKQSSAPADPPRPTTGMPDVAPGGFVGVHRRAFRSRTGRARVGRSAMPGALGPLDDCAAMVFAPFFGRLLGPFAVTHSSLSSVCHAVRPKCIIRHPGSNAACGCQSRSGPDLRQTIIQRRVPDTAGQVPWTFSRPCALFSRRGCCAVHRGQPWSGRRETAGPFLLECLMYTIVAHGRGKGITLWTRRLIWRSYWSFRRTWAIMEADAAARRGRGEACRVEEQGGLSDRQHPGGCRRGRQGPGPAVPRQPCANGHGTGAAEQEHAQGGCRRPPGTHQAGPRRPGRTQQAGGGNFRRWRSEAKPERDRVGRDRLVQCGGFPDLSVAGLRTRHP